MCEHAARSMPLTYVTSVSLRGLVQSQRSFLLCHLSYKQMSLLIPPVRSLLHKNKVLRYWRGGSSLHQRGTLFDSPAKLKTLWIPNHERGDSLLFQETCYSLLLLLKCQSSTIFPSPSLAPSLSLPPSLSVLPHAPLPESIPCALTCSSIEFILRAADECFVISNHCIFQDQLCLSQYLQKEVMKMMLIMMHKADF